MIITDASHKDSLIPKDPQVGESSTSHPPPPYSQASANPYESGSNVPPTAIAIVHRQSPGLRFLRAFAVAALIWFLVGALTQSIFGLGHRDHRHQGDWNVPLPEEQIDHCVSGVGWERGHNSELDTYLPYHATTSFELPADSDSLFMIARGALSSGGFEIIESTAMDAVVVNVTVRYYLQELLGTTSVCKLKRDGDQHGIGIFTPKHWIQRSRADQLRFDITVHLPTSKGNSPLLINSLETSLPLFSHMMGDLRDKVKFRSLSLGSTDMPIIVQTVYADNVKVKTLNGPITGSFKTSTRLDIVTANAPINVDVELINDSGQFTDLRMKTANGPIDAKVSLLSSSGGNYTVSAISGNGHISVGFPKSPIDSTLQLDATTANSPATVILNPAYEGPFQLCTTPFSRVFVETQKVDDPAGKNRMRRLIQNGDHRSVVDGRVWWGSSEMKTKSWVKVKTANSNVRLVL